MTIDRKTPSVTSNSAKVVCLSYAELTASGNLGLVHVDEGDDEVQPDVDDRLERSSFTLARRGWSGLYCGARLVSSDLAEIRSKFPARGKSLLFLCRLTNLAIRFTQASMPLQRKIWKISI